MKDMMKRCLSLGFSLSIIVLMRIRGVNIAASGASDLAKMPALPPPAPAPPRLTSAPMVEMPPMSTLRGTVVRDTSRFALRQADGALVGFDSAGRAWSFEGEDVKVTGYLHPESRLLHICAIEEVDGQRAEAV
ncbi:MAG TPA: hypothetical protein VFD98_16490 [Terracidiphilus sp.]|jgi:hypothetical protein|nr:hypothetical protein [Terracidiphilus sp.]